MRLPCGDDYRRRGLQDLRRRRVWPARTDSLGVDSPAAQGHRRTCRSRFAEGRPCRPMRTLRWNDRIHSDRAPLNPAKRRPRTQGMQAHEANAAGAWGDPWRAESPVAPLEPGSCDGTQATSPCRTELVRIQSEPATLHYDEYNQAHRLPLLRPQTINRGTHPADLDRATSSRRRRNAFRGSTPTPCGWAGQNVGSRPEGCVVA